MFQLLTLMLSEEVKYSTENRLALVRVRHQLVLGTDSCNIAEKFAWVNTFETT